MLLPAHDVAAEVGSLAADQHTFAVRAVAFDHPVASADELWAGLHACRRSPGPGVFRGRL
jgi:hypothetical protein